MVYEIDPLCDVRWPRLLARHKAAGVYHSPEWLETIRRTYGYPAVALTTSPPEQELNSALVFCRVQSWLTGKRLVSLPFSDHCAPLVDGEDELTGLLSGLKNRCDAGARQYIEIRPSHEQWQPSGFTESARFYLHRVDLRPSLDEIFGRFHHSCVRRRIARAQRANLVYEEGRSETLLKHFYRLAILTRRRQRLPPQPLTWFRNLVGCLGERLKIRILFQSGRPAAGILTLRYRETMTFKYGFSDQRFHNLGGTQLLLWKAIQDAKSEGLLEFDLGRSDWAGEGLRRFKDRWGATRSSIVYLRYPDANVGLRRAGVGMRLARRVFAMAPDRILTTAGNLLYRHMA